MNETATAPQAPPTRADVVVIGAGAAGLASARAAAAEGAAVVVLADPERPAASSVAAGMIAPVGEASWGEEVALVAGLAAAREWPRFAASLAAESGLDVPYRRCGSLHVALDADEAAALERLAGLHESQGLGSKRVLGSECRRLEPGLATAVRSGLVVGAEAEVDPRALLAALRAAAEQKGARLLGGRAVSVDGEAGVVRMESGAEIDADRVVLAAGAWSAAEGLLSGPAALPVRPVRGEILRLRAAAGCLPAERIIRGERFYLVPRVGGEIVIGATADERGFDHRVSAGGVHELLREAYRALPELAELEFVEAAAGLRPGSPDNAPIIGGMPGAGRLIVATGLYRNGILLTPLVAAGVAALLAGRPLPAELDPFGPARFALEPRRPLDSEVGA